MKPVLTRRRGGHALVASEQRGRAAGTVFREQSGCGYPLFDMLLDKRKVQLGCSQGHAKVFEWLRLVELVGINSYLTLLVSHNRIVDAARNRDSLQ